MSQTTPIRRAWQTGRWVLLALVIGLVSAWLASSILINLENLAGDILFRLRGSLQEPTNTVIVAIDDASFDQTDLQWPWPRDYLAKVVDGVAAGKPSVIAIDIFLYEASEPEKDQALADAIARAGNVVLVNDISQQQQAGVSVRKLNTPIPEINDVVATLGLTNFERDNDGAVRRLLAFQAHNDELYYSWGLQSVRLYEAAGDDFNVLSADRVDIGGHQIQLEDQYLRVNYRGPAGSIPSVSAYQVVDGLYDVSRFEGKIVLIGTTSESLHDSYPTPFGSQPPMPGVEINANSIETILDNQYLTSVRGLTAVLAVIAALAGIALALRLKPLTALGIVVILAVVYLTACVGLFIGARVIMPMVGPLMGIVATYITGTSIQLYDEQRKRAEVRSLFERYVAPAAIDQMLTQPDTYALGGQRKELTILFSDIRGFTTLSEGLAPDDVVEILNQYLSTMTELIFTHQGTIDKFEGDAILAIWNAPLAVPNHADRAVECAIEMIHALERLQTAWSSKSSVPLRIGVGINTGQAFVGNIGSTRRMDYTVIGDTVNLASRLQDLTKGEGVPVLFSEATRDQLSSTKLTKFVTTATVKGRAQAVNVYTVEEFKKE